MADNGETVVWNVDMEVSLFHAMRGHKPVGVNRHFQMVFIHSKINESQNKKLSADQIWKQLSTLYQLQALNESEILPFPNKETDFTLPDEEYQDLKRKQEFPRMQKPESTNNEIKETKEQKEIKTEKSEKQEGGGKSHKSGSHKNDVKGSPAVSSGKKEGKSSSTPQNKSEGKGSSTPQNKSDSKHVHSTSSHYKDKSKEHLNSSSVEKTPKRKRTRQTNSAAASPATPNDTPPIKRRK